MSNRNRSRLRRARKSRGKIARLESARLSVFRTPRHFYAQIFDPTGARVLAASSTLDPEIRKSHGQGGNCKAATAVGAALADSARQAGIERVAFDRSGYRYHGRIKAFADSAREHGLKF